MAAPHLSSRTPINPLPEPPVVTQAMARAHRRYWCFNVALIAVLMTIGFLVSFVVPLVAPLVADVRFAGFSLPFYLGAQGAILVYLALIAIYIVLMQRADRVLLTTLNEEAAALASQRQPRA
ncbi:DUF4212 domain-containing protein [Paraburkholderia kururiensis]|uniref:DUF4212 domain-containing protein n=1 Tax=Paraburkholderia kururiensis TaxID=984307 RepID=UPI0005A6769D|nr:DUF4212 domain-containing protein [Paraburkholderia kururiensis]